MINDLNFNPPSPTIPAPAFRAFAASLRRPLPGIKGAKADHIVIFPVLGRTTGENPFLSSWDLCRSALLGTRNEPAMI